MLYCFINKMLGPSRKESQSPYRKHLSLIAQLSNYEPVASISKPSQGFNYTIDHNRYSQQLTSRVYKRKQHGFRQHDNKLTTILQTQSPNQFFPKIANHRQNQSTPCNIKEKKVQRLRSHYRKEQQSTEATRERSLTIDSYTLEDGLSSDNILQSRKLGRDQCLSQYSDKSSFSPKRKITQLNAVNTSLIAAEIRQSQQEDSQSDEYIKEASPGPGSYNYSYSDFDKKDITKISTSASFLSKLTRLPLIKSRQQQVILSPEPFEVEKEKRREARLKNGIHRKSIPFNSGSPRQFQLDNLKQKSPGPQNYYPRMGIEEELIKKIQRNFKGNFGCNSQRFQQNKSKQSHLGPGSYRMICPTEVSSFNENFYFKSDLPRFAIP